MGLLTLAGMVSGAGEGLSKAASQTMAVYSEFALREERDKMEMRRQQLLESHALAREQRGYEHAEKMQAGQQAFARGQQQEQFGQRQVEATLSRQQQEDQAKRERERQRNPDEIAADAAADKAKFEAGANTRTAKRTEEAQSEIDHTDLLVNSPTYLQSQQALAAAKESPSQKIEAAIKTFQLEGSREEKRFQEDYVKAVQSGDKKKIDSAKRAYEAFAQKPWEADKVDAANVTAGLKEASIEVTRLQSMMKDAPPGSPEAQVLQRRLSNAEAAHDAYDVRLRQLTGTKPKTDKGALQIVDPAAKSTLTQEPGVEEYLAQMRQQTAQRAAALKSATQQAGQAAMEAERPGMAAATVPPIQPASPPIEPRARMERQVPPRMQQPGEASDPTGIIAFVRPKRSVKSHPPTPLPRELPRVETQGSAPVDPMTAFATTQPANVPRELPQATSPKGIIAAVREPGIIDPDGTQAANDGTEPAPTDFDGQQATQDAIVTNAGTQSQSAGRRITRPISPDNLRSLLTTDQKLAIARMQERVLKPGKTEKPATPGQLQDLLIKVLGPIYRDNGQGPGDLAEGVNQMMKTLLPERTTRR